MISLSHDMLVEWGQALVRSETVFPLVERWTTDELRGRMCGPVQERNLHFILMLIHGTTNVSEIEKALERTRINKINVMLRSHRGKLFNLE